MACRTYDDSEYLAMAQEKARMLEASLCAVLSAMPGPVMQGLIDRIDWNEAGVTKKEFTEWWREHQQADAERRKREDEQRRLAELRRTAKSKLTKEELDAIKRGGDD